jgi:hypothetical protein
VSAISGAGLIAPGGSQISLLAIDALANLGKRRRSRPPLTSPKAWRGFPLRYARSPG